MVGRNDGSLDGVKFPRLAMRVTVHFKSAVRFSQSPLDDFLFHDFLRRVAQSFLIPSPKLDALTRQWVRFQPQASVRSKP